MPKALIACVVTSTLFLSGCTQSQIGNFTPTSSPESAPPPAAFAADLDTTPVSYTNTTNWSKFSFPTFALFLPKDFQVTGLGPDHSPVTLTNFAANPDRPYQPDSDHNHFFLTITLSHSLATITAGDTTAGLPAQTVTQDDHTIITLVNAAQNLTYTLDFAYDFTSQKDLIDRILPTLEFNTRSSL